ncbi:uncharacterized protein si:busm1-163l24.3 [Triplophysa rosa]|uniref:RING-type E3 ubiquitin transferase n=2 Tax=Triplophysa rosa TaxID=992332 RepID=A0A9W7TVL7_TRIRA|nr:uncharacterized protein si:busm1-163l24.3 [Triplophysa rosa]XP_057202744.1 uncharacterized protein si:busm1-163l24.3 [Triplophysa rosa]XP_057202745.1 uncharacterized protein si:busm1-163l24.3 [Triplophysa rosa]XP_057202746.1 uncharacterized protein si:busm1-163l24.3 [Triplophysa rosa]KAI7803393.1 hypothetical protein IRJ41_006289 [Triplophysa rosa]
MAEEGRALYVHGLPTDADHERLRDKLLIHFLRARNGGGDVTSVTVISGPPTCALITFEESRVVQSALRHRPHIIELDGRKYELSLSFAIHTPLSLNKVVLDMTVSIDCSQLQQRAETLNTLCCKFPGLHMKPGLIQQTCTLQGTYSEVQDALSYMQKYFSLTQNLSKTKYPDPSENSCHAPEKREDLGSQEQQSWTSSAHQSSEFYMREHGFESTLGLGKEGYGLKKSTKPEKAKVEEGAECRIDETNWQDLSLIMEADVFAYLQNNKEYRHLLQNHGVQVVHVTSDGVTTLYLQSEVPPGSQDTKKMRQAHKELRQLYQQQENCLRKDQLQRRILCLPNGLTAALKNVQSVLPNVLLSYDQDNFYIVGEKSEVSQAKQILLIGTGKGMMGSMTDLPASSSSSASPSPEPFENEQQMKKKNEVQTPMTPKLIGSNTERKGEGGKEYKLAARFKSSGFGGRGLCAKEEMGGDLKSITNKVEMLTLTPNSQSTPPIRPSLSTAGIISHEVTGEGTQTFRMTGLNCTGEDVLFKNQDTLSLNTLGSNTSTGKSTSYPAYTSALATGINATLNPSVNALLDSNTELKSAAPFATSVSTSKSPLRRTSSFSGQLCLKEQVQKNQIATGSLTNTHAHQRARSNSLSGGKDSIGLPVSTVEAEVTVSSVMWNYIKEAYLNQVDSIKSDLQMSEKQVGKTEVSVVLKGTESSKVEESHRQFQNLVAMVASDFTVRELRLAELGLVEKDEVFEACCTDVQSRFRKVILHTLMDRVFMLGPKLLCSQVSDIFREVFPVKDSNSFEKTVLLQEGVAQGTAKASLSTLDQMSNRVPKVDHFKSDQNEMVPSNSGQTKCKSQSTKQKLATFERSEKLKSKDELSKSSLPSQSNDVRKDQTGLRSDEQSSFPPRAHKKEDISLSLKQTNLLSHKPLGHCVCGASGPDVKLTSCGVILCSVCLPKHSQCRVCGLEELHSKKKVLENPVHGSKAVRQNQMQEHQEEQHSGKEARKDQNGIRGTVRFSEISLSIPGFDRYTTAKITYCIPDGIQGDTDPCPGSSFQGGLFEAYLPLSSKGWALLCCLKKAFHQGLTFAVSPGKIDGEGGKVTWGKIPHKTKMDGGKSLNGYPDSSYLNHLTEILVAHGIE